MTRDLAPVSFDDEPLILVDPKDTILGYDSKAACHVGEGVLHRAFSVFLLNPEGEILLQQRAPQKLLWPGFWSNSCCSHPRKGEEVGQAATRRVLEELGVSTSLAYLFKFIYHAHYGDVGSEYELCSVLVGRIDGQPDPHPDEVAAWRYVDPATLSRGLTENPEMYTPWFKQEWRRLVDEFPRYVLEDQIDSSGSS